MRIQHYGKWTIIFTKVDYIEDIITDHSVIWKRGWLKTEEIKSICPTYTRSDWISHKDIYYETI